MIRSRQLDFDAVPPGTYLNTGPAAMQGYKVNRFCFGLREAARRDAFKQDPEAVMAAEALDEADRALIRAHDWLGLIRRGANIFVLVRLTSLCGWRLPAAGAQMRGETLDQYMATRNLARKD